MADFKKVSGREAIQRAVDLSGGVAWWQERSGAQDLQGLARAKLLFKLKASQPNEILYGPAPTLGPRPLQLRLDSGRTIELRAEDVAVAWWHESDGDVLVELKPGHSLRWVAIGRR